MDGGNTFQQAANLGTIKLGKNTSSRLDATDAITVGETVDWFKFRIVGRAASYSSMACVFFGSGMTADFYRASAGKKQQIGKPIVKLDGINTARSIKLVSGSYFIKVSNVSEPPNPDPAYGGKIYSGGVGVENFSVDGSGLFS